MGRQNDTSYDQSDAELLSAARSGDTGAYAILWRRHAHAAKAAVRMLAYSEAEDMVSEAFTQIWDQLLSGGGPRENFRAYLIAVARNLSVRNFRERLPYVTGFEAEFVNIVPDLWAANTEEIVVLASETQRVRKVFGSMPERWQQVLLMRILWGCSRSEIGQSMSLSENAVSALLKRARQGLRQAWGQDPTA